MTQSPRSFLSQADGSAVGLWGEIDGGISNDRRQSRRLGSQFRPIVVLAGVFTGGAHRPDRNGYFCFTSHRQPNILFIFTDDHALKAISAYGGSFAETAPTPHLDRIAGEGMLCRHCLVTNSICAPSRIALVKKREGGYTSKADAASGHPDFDGILRRSEFR